jgi:hypothetical protein
MELVLLTVPGCPHAAAFEERLAAALARHPGTVVHRRVITGEREAAEAGLPAPGAAGQQAAADTGHSGAPAAMTAPAAGWHHEPGPDVLVTARSSGSGTGQCPAFSRRGRIPVSIGQPPGAAG